jgi:hypothetical protein
VFFLGLGFFWAAVLCERPLPGSVIASCISNANLSRLFQSAHSMSDGKYAFGENRKYNSYHPS